MLTKSLRLGAFCSLVLTIALGMVSHSAEQAGPPLAHMVFFTLKDRSPAAREALANSCHRYLAGHEGVVSFSVGTIAEDVEEPVSVRDFDVALHLVFRDKAAEKAYIDHPRHKQFVEANKDAWTKVRVFDSYLTRP